MKMNKKYLLIFILFIYFLIVFDLYCNKVHALESYKTVYMPDANINGTYIWGTQQSIMTYNTKNRPFANEGKGTIIFTFTMEGKVAIHSIELYTSNVAGWNCEIGTNTYYNDNTKQLQTHTAKCPVDNIGPNGIVKVNVKGYAWETGSITFGYFWTIVKDEAGQNYEQNIADVYNVINNSATQDRQIAEQAHQDSQSINQSIQDTNNTLNDDSIDNSSADNLTNNDAFKDQNGLEAIIQAPLIFIKNLTNSTCSPINISFPHTNINFNIPCMSSVYKSFLPDELVNIISLVVNGAICYRYCLKLLQMLHDAKNPNKDELEVMDL